MHSFWWMDIELKKGSERNYYIMISLTDLWRKSGLECGGPPLVPFAYSACAYLVLVCGGGGGGGAVGGPAAVALLKCAPVLCLAVMVHAHRARATLDTTRSYSLYTMCGLLLSATGDACLVWAGGLVAGMSAFGAAHVAYLAAFAATPAPRRLPLALLVYAAAAAFTAILTPPASLRWLVPLYAALLASMCWRALARWRAGAGAEASGSWSAAGGVLFLVSDALLAYTMFNGPLPHKQVLVMVTYYLAQLGLALSATRLPTAHPPPPHPRQ